VKIRSMRREFLHGDGQIEKLNRANACL